MKLQKAQWGHYSETTGLLLPITGEQPLKMYFSYGTAFPLVRDESGPQPFGSDLIRFAPGGGVGLHTHVGSHIIHVLLGCGVLVYEDERHDMFPGMTYSVPSNVSHAIEAITELVIISDGNDHRLADSKERLDIAEK